MLFLFLFIHVFDLTIQCPTNVYIAEIWPTAVRSRGIGLSWFAYFVGAITYTTPSEIAFESIGWRMYFVWIACDVVSFLIVYFYVPETSGKTLEEMGDLFGDEVVVHITANGHYDLHEIVSSRMPEEDMDFDAVIPGKMEVDRVEQAI